MDFNSHTDGVVAVACALVNVVTPGWRQGREHAAPTGEDLLRALAEALGPRHEDLTPARAAALVRLGSAARPVFEHVDAGDQDAAAATVNGLLTTYAPTPVLAHHDDEPWHLHFHGLERTDPSGWGGGCAVALATVLGGEHADRLGVCSAPRCDRVFVDVTRNGTRRFCSPACQSRVKAAAHRARSAQA